MKSHYLRPLFRKMIQLIQCEEQVKDRRVTDEAHFSLGCAQNCYCGKINNYEMAEQVTLKEKREMYKKTGRKMSLKKPLGRTRYRRENNINRT